MNNRKHMGKDKDDYKLLEELAKEEAEHKTKKRELK